MEIKIQNQNEIIEHYGCENQIGIAMEESSELIQALSKMRRVSGDIEEYERAKMHLIEEVADVIVCINQIQIMFNISDAKISELANYKIHRQMERMKEGKK